MQYDRHWLLLTFNRWWDLTFLVLDDSNFWHCLKLKCQPHTNVNCQRCRQMSQYLPAIANTLTYKHAGNQYTHNPVTKMYQSLRQQPPVNVMAAKKIFFIDTSVLCNSKYLNRETTTCWWHCRYIIRITWTWELKSEPTTFRQKNPLTISHSSVLTARWHQCRVSTLSCAINTHVSS